MKIKPIPKKMLVHTATYAPYQGKDAYQKATYGDSVQLYNVKFEPVKKPSLTSLGEQKDDRMKMFFDGVNSSPSLTFYEFDKVTFSGQDYIIREAQPFYGLSDSIHHWEIILV